MNRKKLYIIMYLCAKICMWLDINLKDILRQISMCSRRKSIDAVYDLLE